MSLQLSARFLEVAAKALKASGVSGKLPDLAKLKADYKRLAVEKDGLYAEYGKLKKQLREYDAIKQNIDGIHRGANRKKRCNCRRQSHIILPKYNV